MIDFADVHDGESAATLARDLGAAPPDAIVARVVADLGERVVFAVSLGLEDVVLLDLLAKSYAAGPARARVVMLDTGRLHEETLALLNRLEARYRLRIEVLYPDTVAVEALVRKNGVNGFYTSVEARHECCAVRKLAPMARALAGAAAWVTGVRRGQSRARDTVEMIEWDGRLKINPLAQWTEGDVWAYVRQNDVPFNPLHERGFPSIGCAPCTRAVEPGEDPRAGRWWWEQGAEGVTDQRECGLHTPRAAAIRAAAIRGSG